jgi:hypothetical protein
MSWCRQIWYALEGIDQRGTSKHEAKRRFGYSPGQGVPGVCSDGCLNTVFERRLTFTHWLGDHYPEVRPFRDLDTSLLTEYLGEKSQVCQPATARTILACLRKIEEALWARRWIMEAMVPAEWAEDSRLSLPS